MADDNDRNLPPGSTDEPDGEVSWEWLQDWMDRIYGTEKPSGVVDDLIAERREEASRE